LSRRSAGNGLLLLAVVVLVGGLAGPKPPCLILGDSVHDDLAILARQTWERFLTAFRSRWNCFGNVRLEAVYDLDGRAGYDPTTATAMVHVPGTAAMLQSGLVHEWAHHVEFQCPAHQSLRPALTAAQGLPPDAPWRPVELPGHIPAGLRADIPSERYAEAVVALVLGGRPISTGAQVTPAEVEIVRAWGVGRR